MRNYLKILSLFMMALAASNSFAQTTDTMATPPPEAQIANRSQLRMVEERPENDADYEARIAAILRDRRGLLSRQDAVTVGSLAGITQLGVGTWLTTRYVRDWRRGRVNYLDPNISRGIRIGAGFIDLDNEIRASETGFASGVRVRSNGRSAHGEADVIAREFTRRIDGQRSEAPTQADVTQDRLTGQRGALIPNGRRIYPFGSEIEILVNNSSYTLRGTAPAPVISAATRELIENLTATQMRDYLSTGHITGISVPEEAAAEIRSLSTNQLEAIFRRESVLPAREFPEYVQTAIRNLSAAQVEQVRIHGARELYKFVPEGSLAYYYFKGLEQRLEGRANAWVDWRAGSSVALLSNRLAFNEGYQLAPENGILNLHITHSTEALTIEAADRNASEIVELLEREIAGRTYAGRAGPVRIRMRVATGVIGGLLLLHGADDILVLLDNWSNIQADPHGDFCREAYCRNYVGAYRRVITMPSTVGIAESIQSATTRQPPAEVDPATPQAASAQ